MAEIKMMAELPIVTAVGDFGLLAVCVRLLWVQHVRISSLETRFDLFKERKI